MCIGSLLICAALFRGISGYGAPFLMLVFAAGVITCTFYGWLPLYLPELFPPAFARPGRASRQLRAHFRRAGALQMGALMQVFGGSYARAGAVITLIYVWAWAPSGLGRRTKGARCRSEVLSGMGFSHVPWRTRAEARATFGTKRRGAFRYAIGSRVGAPALGA